MALIDIFKWDSISHVLMYHYSSCKLNYKLLLIVTKERLIAFTKKTLSGYFRRVIVTSTKDVITSLMTGRNCSLLQIETKLNELSHILQSQGKNKWVFILLGVFFRRV